MSSYSNLDPDGLQELMGGPHLLVDVRTDREIERGMIPGALHLPLHMLPARMQEIGQGRPVVVYCQSGVRSVQASLFLAQNGREQIYNLTGGFSAWAARGFPVAQKLRSGLLQFFRRDRTRWIPKPK